MSWASILPLFLMSEVFHWTLFCCIPLMFQLQHIYYVSLVLHPGSHMLKCMALLMLRWRPVYGEIEFECGHWAVFENAIDMAHIHYLHADSFGNKV